ncbi:MAG TPA: tripartite tricarboxylate transporter substrate binding protein [Xanthobacteraceae bacterium]|jgi:tripartite-type tricarboxylate transporter receptor subunit TctC|nr:tripartite tricarboxylate transporter substrate binding protein [Xanthobacteraceae bacterium]
MLRALLAALLCAGWLFHGGNIAHAQAYPGKEPIKIIVPFPPGGPSDGMARIISERLGTVLGQSIVIENRGGAGGGIGGKFVAAADPDGYTLLLTPGGALTTGPAVNPDIGYDPVKVFASVCQLIETPLIISVHPDLPVKSMAEVVAYAKANPGKVRWGSQGFGTAPHLLAEMFKLDAGVNILNVPYRGTGPLLNAILANEVNIIADPSTTSLPYIEAGKLRPIAIAGKVRHPKLPDVPTVVEAGFPKLQSPFWLAVVAPAATPPDIIGKLNSAFRQALAAPETRARLDALGAEIKIGTPQDLDKMLAAERAQWSAVVKAANIKME